MDKYENVIFPERKIRALPKTPSYSFKLKYTWCNAVDATLTFRVVPKDYIAAMLRLNV